MGHPPNTFGIGGGVALHAWLTDSQLAKMLGAASVSDLRGARRVGKGRQRRGVGVIKTQNLIRYLDITIARIILCTSINVRRIL